MHRITLPAAWVVAMFLIVGLAGCGNAPGTDRSHRDRVELTFWSWEPKIHEAVDLWNKNNVSVHVTLAEVARGSDGTYAKLTEAAKGGAAPDISEIENVFVSHFASQGSLVDLSPLVGGKTLDAFPTGTWSQVSNETSIYAIPQDVAPMTLLYRRDLFAAAGIHNPPTTWPEYAADAAKIRKSSPRISIGNFPTNQADWYTGLVWQAGGTWFNQKGANWAVTVNGEESRRVGAFWQDLIRRDLVKPEDFWSDGWRRELQDGTLASWIVGAWGVSSLEGIAPQTRGKWTAAPLPQWRVGANQTGGWGGSSDAVFKSSKHPVEATRFISWLNSDPAPVGLLAGDGGLFMAATAFKGTGTFSAADPFFGGERVVETIGAQQFNSNWRWGPVMADVFAAFQDASADLDGGHTTINGSLVKAQSKALAVMKTENLPSS